MLDLMIKGATAVLPQGDIRADVGIRGEKLAWIGRGENAPKARRVVETEGMIVFPGLIDPHVHFMSRGSGAPPEEMERGTRAAALGGITTVIDLAVPDSDGAPGPAVARSREGAHGRAAVDYSFHVAVIRAAPALKYLPRLIEEGFPSFKCFMAYREQGVMCGDGDLLSVLKETRGGGLLGVHAENADIIEGLVEQALADGRTGAIHHALTRPPVSEAEAYGRALFLAESQGAALYGFHLSTATSVEMTARARELGRPVYGETCTHYLVLTQERLAGEDGRNFVCSPPLRTSPHVEALWEGVRQGHISVISSDECTFSSGEKADDGGDFTGIPNGLPGMEFRLPLMYREGVIRRGLSLPRVARLLSTNAAVIFGLYPQKGVIQPGSDADLVVIDPRRETVLSADDSATGLDWHPYQGLRASGWPPVMTISRGRVVAQEGRFLGDFSWGRLLPRRLPAAVLERPVG